MTFDSLLRWGFYAIRLLVVIVILVEAIYRWRTRPALRPQPEPIEHVREGEV